MAFEIKPGHLNWQIIPPVLIDLANVSNLNFLFHSLRLQR